MKKLAASILIALLPASAAAGNYATCLLKHLPGLQNDAAANAAIRLCMNEHPSAFNGVPQGDGRSFLGYDSGAECAMKKAGETRSQRAGQMIYVACRRLYDEPKDLLSDQEVFGNQKPWINPFDQFDKR